MMTLIQNSITNLKSHKLRVGITVFWLIVGISSVILVGSIGNGAVNKLKESVAKMEEKTIEIGFWLNDPTMQGMEGFFNPFTKEDLDTIRTLPNVADVKATNAGDSLISGQGVFNKKETYVEIYPFMENGKDPNQKYVQMEYGRAINEWDKGKNVIVLNSRVAQEILPTGEFETLLGRGLEINGVMYEIIGIMPDYQSMQLNEWSNVYYASLVPKSTVDQLSKMASSPYLGTRIEVKARTGVDLGQLEGEVVALLKRNHPTLEGVYSRDFQGGSQNQEMELQQMVTLVNQFVAAIIAVSMFVGGLGVMNIMYVSVVERKREIGIRRAIGATPRKIISQFLAEASFITLLGGIAGMVVGTLLLIAIKAFLPLPLAPTLGLYALAVFTSIATGVIFGFIPAYRASKIDPIEAIRG